MLSITYFERVVREALSASGNQLDALPMELPQSGISLPDAPELIQILWNAALCDVESNLVETEGGGLFFSAGGDGDMHLSSRDLSLAGLLGLNQLFPEYMKKAFSFAREARLSMGWRICADEQVGDIWAPWKPEALDRKGFIEKYDTDSIIQNTDDVVWLWAAHDLFSHHLEASEEDWQWLYDMGVTCFEQFYSYFYDEVDEMYCAQAFGVAIHRPEELSDGYPKNWGLAECVHCHPTSTNALYVKAFEVMADVAERCGRVGEVPVWQKKAELLRESIRVDMCHDEGSMAYYRDRVGKLTGRRHALADAFSVLHGVVTGEHAKELLASYPYDKVGVPLLHPAFASEERVYNHTAWPYASTFFFMAREMTKKSAEIPANAVAVARSFVKGSFHERMDYKTGEVLGSSRNLCAAASWINVCLRAGLTPSLNLDSAAEGV